MSIRAGKELAKDIKETKEKKPIHVVVTPPISSAAERLPFTPSEASREDLRKRVTEKHRSGDHRGAFVTLLKNLDVLNDNKFLEDFFSQIIEHYTAGEIEVKPGESKKGKAIWEGFAKILADGNKFLARFNEGLQRINDKEKAARAGNFFASVFAYLKK